MISCLLSLTELGSLGINDYQTMNTIVILIIRALYYSNTPIFQEKCVSKVYV